MTRLTPVCLMPRHISFHHIVLSLLGCSELCSPAALPAQVFPQDHSLAWGGGSDRKKESGSLYKSSKIDTFPWIMIISNNRFKVTRSKAISHFISFHYMAKLRESLRKNFERHKRHNEEKQGRNFIPHHHHHHQGCHCQPKQGLMLVRASLQETFSML